MLWQEVNKYTVMYSVHIRFWPTLLIAYESNVQCLECRHTSDQLGRRKFEQVRCAARVLWDYQIA